MLANSITERRQRNLYCKLVASCCLRLKKNLRITMKYFLVAGLIWLAGNSILILLLGISNQVLATVASTSSVVLLDFFAKKNFVFRSSVSIKKSFIQYLALTAFSWLVLNFGLHIGISYGLSIVNSVVVANICVGVFAYIIQHLIFTPKSPK